MIRGLTGAGACFLLLACAPQLPESGPVSATVAQSTQNLPPVSPVQASPLGQASADPSAPLPSSVTSAVIGGDPFEQRAAALNSGVVPLEASPSNPAPEQIGAAGISSEQDFGAVSSRRTIQSDAQKIAANRAQYQVIEPTALPQRSGGSQPNIVQYALATNNPVGAQLYKRSRLRSGRLSRACSGFASPDQAQIEFLAQGGPQKDRKGLDPDGDGYACSWDPRPFRTARQAAAPLTAISAVDNTQTPAPAPVQQPAPGVVPPLAISTE